MDNIVTVETAKALKAAGFPQPEPKEGQIWYGLIQRQEQALFIIFDGDFFVDRYGNCYGKEAFENWGTFAPTATDILREMSDISIRWHGKYWFVELTNGQFGDENPAEAAAMAFLESVKNGGYSEAETNCRGCMGPCGQCDESDGSKTNVATIETVNENQLPDWENAPAWAIYRAVDANGERFYHEEKPYISDDEWLSFKRLTHYDDVSSGNWREPLEERPGNKNLSLPIEAFKNTKKNDNEGFKTRK